MEPGSEAVDYTFLAALLLAGIHWFGPHIRIGLHRRGEVIRSFGGGVAVAYVFLSLLPEIELAHEWLGDGVHFLTLTSFLLFYVLEVRILSLRRTHIVPQAVPRVSGGDHGAVAIDASGVDGSARLVFWWHVALIWVYTWMVIFSFPEETGGDLVVALIATLAIGIHLIYKDFILRTHHAESFAAKGRLLLAIAPIVGFIAHEIIAPPEAVFELFIAVLAGILMQGVFRDELPTQHNEHVRWMIAGAGTFAVLSLITI